MGEGGYGRGERETSDLGVRRLCSMLLTISSVYKEGPVVNEDQTKLET